MGNEILHIQNICNNNIEKLKELMNNANRDNTILNLKKKKDKNGCSPFNYSSPVNNIEMA